MIKEYMEASKKSTDLIRELMRDSSVEKDTLASRGISYRVAKEILETGIYNERGFGSWSTEDLISYTFPLNSNYGSKENDYTKYILKSVLPEGLAAVEGVFAEREIVTIDGLSYRVIKSETLTPLQYVTTARSEEKLSKYDIDYNTNVLKGLGYQKVVVIELELIGAVE